MYSFNVCFFATNNKFTVTDVSHRICYVTDELKLHGIHVLTDSADGNKREMKMMKQSVELGLPSPINKIKSKKE